MQNVAILLLDYLKADGFQTFLDSDGDIQFKYESHRYALRQTRFALCFIRGARGFGTLVEINVNTP